MTSIVFLHIPKTAGQTVHNEIARVLGEKNTSPVRVHTQADEAGQFPAGYKLYSGHLDWTGVDSLPDDKFVFSILRDPRERIASFYFYLLKKAETLPKANLELPQHTGLRTVLNSSADDYFFGGNPGWQRFIRDHYDNFYCSYFASRKMRGRVDLIELNKAEVLEQALRHANAIDAVYSLDTLHKLEDDLEPILKKRVSIVGNRHNAGPKPAEVLRWPELIARFESDSSIAELEKFVTLDEKFCQQVTYR